MQSVDDTRLLAQRRQFRTFELHTIAKENTMITTMKTCQVDRGGMMRRHAHENAFDFLNARVREGLTVPSRRNFLKASMAGMAGLSFPGLLEQRANAAAAGRGSPRGKSVILLWMAGGPSHIDTLDMKPD